MPLKIFISYAHKDEALLKELKKHLYLLQREGLIWLWHARDISAGTEWKDEIDKHLNRSSIILLLISPDFMASDYCYSIELKRAVERHDKGEAHVIPIILRHVEYTGAPFSRLQVIPKDALPVTDRKWHNRDRAFVDITQQLRKKIEDINKEEKNKKDLLTLHDDLSETKIFSRAEIKAAKEALPSLATEPLPHLKSGTSPYLCIKQGNELWKIFPVTGALTIGREDDNDIPLEDTTASRKHALVYFNDDGECSIEDTGSSNGTILNGKILRKGDIRVLKEGDQIQIGRTYLVFNSSQYSENT